MQRTLFSAIIAIGMLASAASPALAGPKDRETSDTVAATSEKKELKAAAKESKAVKKTEKKEQKAAKPAKGEQKAKVGEKMVSKVEKQTAKIEAKYEKLAPPVVVDGTSPELDAVQEPLAAARALAEEALALFQSAASSENPKQAFKDAITKLQAARAQMTLARKALAQMRASEEEEEQVEPPSLPTDTVAPTEPIGPTEPVAS